jgi:hypothetical protein
VIFFAPITLYLCSPYYSGKEYLNQYFPRLRTGADKTQKDTERSLLRLRTGAERLRKAQRLRGTACGAHNLLELRGRVQEQVK